MQFTYETKRLSLRVLTPEHASAVCQFYLDNRDFLEPFEPKRPENFYTKNFQASNLNYEYRAFLKMTNIRYWIFEKTSLSQPVGSICFSHFLQGSFKKCNLGYKLSQDYCHKGYMTEALSFLIPVVSQELRLHRIEAYVQPDNRPSASLLSRLDFMEEGYLRSYAEINGTWTDHLIFSLICDHSGK